MERASGWVRPIWGAGLVAFGVVLMWVSRDVGCALALAALLVLIGGWAVVNGLMARRRPALDSSAGSQLGSSAGPAPDLSARPQFMVVLRGYDPGAVDSLVETAREALASADESLRARAAAQLDRGAAELVPALRGYDRRQVDAYVRELSAALTGR